MERLNFIAEQRLLRMVSTAIEFVGSVDKMATVLKQARAKKFKYISSTFKISPRLIPFL